MQGYGCFREGLEDAIYIIEVGYRDKIWEEKTSHPRQRNNLPSKSHKRELYYERLRENALVRSAESVGEGENIYIFCSQDGGEDSDGQAEDQDIDDSQSKGWRGG